jgi:transposase
VVRRAARGRPHHEIAAALAITTRTVQRWLNRSLEPGRAGLEIRKATRAAAKIPAARAAAVRRWVIAGPQAQGLDRANWTAAARAEHLFRPPGITARRAARPRFGRTRGIRGYRPTDHFLRGAPEQQAKARQALAELKRGRKPASSSC